MAHEIKLLSLTDVFVESSFLVLGRNMGTPVWVHTWGVLILGNPAGPILVDTGARDPEIMGRLGMQGRVDEDMQLENALAAHGVAIGDVAAVLHTHCHIDHAGQDDRFPMTTPVVMNRRELEHSASGTDGRAVPARVREAPHRPAAHARGAAPARPRALRAGRDLRRDRLRGRGRAYGGLDEHPRRDRRRGRPASAAT